MQLNDIRRIASALLASLSVVGFGVMVIGQQPPTNRPAAIPQSNSRPSVSPKTAQQQPPASVPQGVVVVSGAEVKFVNNEDIAAPADGLISELLLEEGEPVQKDSVIVKLDERLAKAELEIARQESEADAQVAANDANVRFARNSLEVAKKEYENAKTLFDKSSGSEADLRRKELEKTKAELSIELAELEQVKNQSKANITAEKFRAAEVQLGLRSIKAPFDGVIAERRRDPGAWVRAGDPILKLVSMKDLRVEGSTSQLFKIAPHMLYGAPVRISILVANEMAPVIVDSKIDYVSPRIGTDNSVRVWARVTNQQVDGKWLFYDGMDAEMQIVLPNGNGSTKRG